jgi:anaerobic selenocysteine-containing dehydrogenase
MVRISRRGFLKTTAAAAAAVAIGPKLVGGEAKAETLLRPASDGSLISGKETRLMTNTTGGPCWTYTQNGRMTRVESTWFTPEEAKAGHFPWTVPARTRPASPKATNTGPWPGELKIANWLPGVTARSWVYGNQRGQYPMKRVDWDPKGERNPQNRGKSGYVRITWDEALDLMAAELVRIKKTYGNAAFYSRDGMHKEWGTFCAHESGRFWASLGGVTSGIWVPNSWEGWCYGSSFVYGYYWLNGMATQRDCLTDTLQSSDRIVFWGNDALVTAATYGGSALAKRWTWFKELDFPIICINPQFAWTAKFATRWIPIIPGTDSALALAIAYVWIKEGTYEKQVMDTHVIGFDEKTLPKGVPPKTAFKYYVTGEADGVPKTPEWASNICGVPARDIRSLAREWADGNTSFNCFQAGLSRTAYDYETCRLLVMLQIMHGYGQPGKNAWTSGTGAPRDWNVAGLIGYSDGPMNLAAKIKPPNPVGTVCEINDQLMHYCISSHPTPVSFTGGRSLGGGVDGAFRPSHYPVKGYSTVHCLYNQGTHAGQQAEKGRWFRMYQDPTIEAFFLQAPWFETDATFADIYLPITTPFERVDLAESGKNSLTDMKTTECRIDWRICVYQPKVIEPVFESRNDWDVYVELAKRIDKLLGPDSKVYDTLTDGGTKPTMEDWLHAGWDYSMANGGNIPMTYEEFKQKGYWVVPHPDDYYTNPIHGYMPGLSWFLNKTITDPKQGVSTPTGKFEFFSTKLYDHYGLEDPNAGCGAIPKFRQHWEARNTDANSLRLLGKYPLTMMSHHPRFRYHGKYHGVAWMRDLWKIRGPDGKQYEPIRMNPVDVKARGLKNHDIVRVFNDRGQILCAVDSSEKIVPGATAVVYGSWNDFSTQGDSRSVDRSGDSNILTPAHPPRNVQEHSMEASWNTNLVQVEKWKV